ncbi:FGGY-family pentulose kinase [Blastocladiella britannica]|nr:FGGY-family pentulose kinase [Blastocladiella britannica]
MAFYFIGVDVGTSSARAIVIDRAGRVLGAADAAIEIHHPRPDYYEQSTDDIWRQCCASVKAAIAAAAIDPLLVAGIGFDATCSLVALDGDYTPVSLSVSGDTKWNVIMWMDHRAAKETTDINAMGHPVLKVSGGALSIEMEIPKLLWVSGNMPSSFDQAAHWFDLPDYLTWRASGSLARSECSLACKWTYLPTALAQSMGREPGFQADFLESIGLSGINARLLGPEGAARQVGGTVGHLTAASARELGLHEAVAVGVSMIDAYAGALATISHPTSPIANNLALIAGTSACHIAISPANAPVFVPGVWGPYEGVLLPGTFAMEGGQSAAGKMVDHLIAMHPAATTVRALAESRQRTVYAELNAQLEQLAIDRGCQLDELARDMHVYPDFHGNRSPLSDPTLRGGVVGLSLDASSESLAIVYLAALHALALQTRHIIAVANESGFRIQRICMSGGLVNNSLAVRIMADAVGVPVGVAAEPDTAVVFGAAVLGAAAAPGVFQSLTDAMSSLCQSGDEVTPTKDPALVSLFEKKHRAFHAMLDAQLAIREIMKA